MRKVMLLSLLPYLAAFGAALAQPAPTPIKTCAGVADGSYVKAAHQIKKQSTTVPVTVINTEGSLNNLDRLTKGECEVAFVQSDATLVYSQKNAVTISTLERGGVLYPEYVHILVNRKAGINKLADLKGKTCAVGGEGSGSRTTLDALKLANRDAYGSIRVDDRSGDSAFAAVADGNEIQCAIWVGAKGSPTIKTYAQQYGDQIKLISSYDEGLVNNAKDNTGRQLYQKGDISAKLYPRLLDSGYFSNDYDMTKMDALIIANRDFTRQRKDDWTAFLRAARNAGPDIEKIGNPQ